MKALTFLLFTLLSLNTIAQVSSQADTLKSNKVDSLSNLSEEEQIKRLEEFFSAGNKSEENSTQAIGRPLPLRYDICDKPIIITVQIDMNGDVVDITNVETDVEEQACIYNAKNAVRRMKFPSSTDSTKRYATITFN